MQAPAMLRIVAPGLPGRQKIEPEPETGFENDETATALPALRQVVATEKTCRACCGSPCAE